MQRVAVLGLGRFGMNLARQLEVNRVEVIAADKNHRLVDEVKDDVTLAVCLDSTDAVALASHEIHEADVCVVAIGENFEASLLTATALKQLGANKVIVRAQSATHAEIFRRLGADEVVQPETESGRELARRLANPRLQDLVELSDDFALIELKAPLAFQGKTPEQLAMRSKYGVTLIAVKRPKPQTDANALLTYTTHVPHASFVIEPGDLLMLVGPDTALKGLPN